MKLFRVVKSRKLSSDEQSLTLIYISFSLENCRSCHNYGSTQHYPSGTRMHRFGYQVWRYQNHYRIRRSETNRSWTGFNSIEHFFAPIYEYCRTNGPVKLYNYHPELLSKKFVVESFKELQFQLILRNV